MMGFQWGTLGLWMVTLPRFIALNTGDAGSGMFGPSFLGDIGVAGALGAILSPFVCGLLVDRFFNTEVVVAVLHGVSALLVLALCYAESQLAFTVLVVAYFQAYAPTSALLSSLALRRLPDSARQFSQVRAMGTVGWIVAGAVVGLWPLATGISIEGSVLPMRLAAACHVVAALYSLRLPKTPPPETRTKERFPGASVVWNNPKVMLFLGVSVLATTTSRFYEGFINQYLNYYEYTYPAFVQTMGQACEVGVMLAVPFFLARFRLKGLFLTGVLCWAARYALLAMAGGQQHPWMVYTAMCLHGFSFVFVFILGQLYIDKLTPPESRGAAQGIHLLATVGLGPLIGARLSGWGQAVWLTPEGVSPAPYDWQSFWFLPCFVSLAAAVVFVLLFRDEPRKEA